MRETDAARDERALSWSWLYRPLKARRLALARLLGLSLSATLMALLPPLLTQRLIDQGLMQGDFATVATYVGALVAVGLSAMALQGLTRLQHVALSARLLLSLRRALLRHLLRLAPARWQARGRGDLMSRLDGDLTILQGFALDSLLGGLSNLLGLVGALAMIGLFSPALMALVAVLVPIQWFWLRAWRPALTRRQEALRAQSGDISGFWQDTLAHGPWFQGQALEAARLNRLQGLGHEQLRRLLAVRRVGFLSDMGPQLILALARAGVLLLGGYLVIQGRLQLGELVALLAYLGMVMAPIGGLLGLYGGWQRARVSASRLAELFAEPAMSDPYQGQSPNGPGALRLEGVRFRHPGQDTWLLDGVSLGLEPGQKVLIEGPSGAGKSSLIRMLLGLEAREAGVIRVDGVPLEALSRRQWLKQVAWVEQYPSLLRGSLASNLRALEPHATDEALCESLRRVGLGEWLASLPNGLETELGDLGGKVSGGQRARLALARALLKRPRLVLLDEPTAALDPAAARAFDLLLDDVLGDTTRLIISHQGERFGHLDARYRLERGRLAPVEEAASCR
ncbi:ABC transporter ATP-binding protein [Halomonas sp. KAO]|uniref:ATP-binding cassette domain-containing protein n=1 Tax=unclassified Halomonas TaxID=2609666 RepID=UPI00189EB8B2|nr:MULTISPECIES: ABC transporter ATP-binding protein [unclassified Halomonas]MBF7054829.1 ABC transporter ATP-binding protein [Halomonas sp. KAO]MDT0500380.1 ABC transporter ATP-binding protein [Halomonas sp. PAR7]MDT0511123.1 ABC transporter ATP-binding protein [Halomonas sp. LES1]MDT0593148.1 ABC transporter ATP-binding protein [Halomonas sp. PAR8]